MGSSKASHWSVDGQTVKVHREFVASIEKPVCTDDVRKEAADALA